MYAPGAKTDRAKKITAGILAVMLLFLMLFSAFYLAAEADHDCTGEDCPICACIRQCGNTLRLMSDGAAAPVIPALLAGFFLLPVLFPAIWFSRQTPISQKVRLNS